MKKKLNIICLLIAVIMLLPSCTPNNVDVFTDDTVTPDYYPPDIEGESQSESDSEAVSEILQTDNGEDSENPFVDVKENATSRVVATPNTASYRHFCDLVNSGYTLNELKKCGYSFKSEEFLNYFSNPAEYSFGDGIFKNNIKVSKCPWDKDNYFLKITLSAGDAEYAKNSNTVFYIDVSESMWDAKMLPMIIENIEAFTSTLDGDDVVSVVTSAPQNSILLDSALGDDTDKISDAFGSITAQSGANSHDALEEAYKLANKNYISGGGNKVVLISDGDISEKYGEIMSEYAQQGIELAVVGLGAGNYKNEKLQKLAGIGGGEYIYIDGANRAKDFLSDGIFKKTQMLAQNLICNISFDESLVSKYRLIGYDSKESGETSSDSQPEIIRMGDVITLCYELELAEDAVPVNEKIADVDISYTAYDSDQRTGARFEVTFDKYVEKDTETELLLGCVQTLMVLKESHHGKNIKLSDIYKQLSDMEIADDPKAEEFIMLLGIITGKIKK